MLAAALTAVLGRQPAALVRSLTWDQGREMARRADVEAALDIEVFFCEPRSPWQRPTNEHTNAPGQEPAHGTSAVSATRATSLPAMNALGAQVWHYWLAVPLTIVTVLTVAKLVVGYVKTVTAPRYPKR